MIDTQELIEALHYIKKFRNQVFIIKFSGEILLDENVLESIATDLVLLHDVGIRPVVMHGAGTLISSNMEKMGLEPRFIRGERVTDERTLDVVVGCLHRVNNKIIDKINHNTAIASDTATAVGLTGGLFKAKRKRKELGYVGDVVDVNSKLIYDLIGCGYIPVILPVGIDEEGNLLNINADIATGELAKALDVTKIILLTNVGGVLGRDGRLIGRLTVSETRDLIKNKVATKGMIPKLESSVNAISEGVERIHIVRAGKHAILGELLTEEGTGTMITK